MTTTLSPVALKEARRSQVKKELVPCPNADCVGGHDVERGDTCRTCNGDEQCRVCVTCGGAISEFHSAPSDVDCDGCGLITAEADFTGFGALDLGGEA